MSEKSLSSALENLNLPELKWYDVCGQKVFAIYGQNNSITTLRVAYIYKREFDIREDRFKWLGAALSFSLEELNKAVDTGSLEKLAQTKLDDALKHLTEFNGDGGSMPPVRHSASKGAE